MYIRQKTNTIRINISLNILNYLHTHHIFEYSLSLDKYFSSEFVDTIIYDIRLFQRYYVLSLLVDLLDVDKSILYEDECWMQNIDKLDTLMSRFHRISLLKYPLLIDSVKKSIEQITTFKYPLSANAFYTILLNEKHKCVSLNELLSTLFHLSVY